MTAQPTRTINQSKIQNFLGKAAGSCGGALGSLLVVLGDKCGLYPTGHYRWDAEEPVVHSHAPKIAQKRTSSAAGKGAPITHGSAFPGQYRTTSVQHSRTQDRGADGELPPDDRQTMYSGAARVGLVVSTHRARDGCPPRDDPRFRTPRVIAASLSDGAKVSADDTGANAANLSAASARGPQRIAFVVLATGSRFTFSVNDIQVAQVTDATLASGAVGVYAGGDGNQVLKSPDRGFSERAPLRA